MARTAPAPNIPPIPGMCPSVAVLGGGGDGGGGRGKGAGSGGNNVGSGAGSGGEGSQGDQRTAPDYKKYPECGYASHPVDVVTGRAFTHPIADLDLPGPLPLVFERMYSSAMASRDVGLGHGWAHTFGWQVEVKRRGITVWNAQGVAVEFPLIPVGSEVLGPWGWVLRREPWGFALDADDGLWHLFSAPDASERCFRLTAIEDRNRNRISLTYEDGRLAEIKDSAGRVLRIRSTRKGRIAAIEVNNAVSQGQWIPFAQYEYDQKGDLIRATDAEGYWSAYEYDELHRMTRDTDRVGLTFRFRYDEQGRCVESWGEYPDGRDPSLGDRPLKRYLHDHLTRAKGIHHCKLDYFDDGYTEVADSTEVRRYFGNRHGTLDKRVEGGAVITATYDDTGNLLSRTDALGNTVMYHRDARGRLLMLIDALGRATCMERDAYGLLTRLTTPAGGVRTIERDRCGNPILEQDETGAVTTCRYDARGLMTELTDPTGDVTRFEYDTHGNLTSVRHADGAVFQYRYDAFGRRLSETDPLGATWHFSYSMRGDLVAVRNPLGEVTRYDYDGEGRVVRITSPTGRTTSVAWGGYHKVCALRDGNGHWTRVAYNAEGQPLLVHNELGEVWRYEHTPAGMTIEETSFDQVHTRYRYDRNNALVEITDTRGRRTELLRNAAGLVTERRLPDGTVEVLEYDALDNVIHATNGTVNVVIERDIAGRVVRESQTVAGETHSVESRWGNAGERAERRTSLGHVLQWHHDHGAGTEDLLLSPRHAVRIERDRLGREVVRHLPRGGQIESGFDPAGRLVRRGVISPAAVPAVGLGEPAWVGPSRRNRTFERTYGYSPEGELAEVADLQRGVTRYRHDAVGQLVEVLPERLRGELFRYDPAGNLYEKTPAGQIPAEYGPGGRLLRWGETTYRWNELGQLVEKSAPGEDGSPRVVRYTWGAAGQLSCIESGDQKVEFVYDAFMRRMEKRVSRRMRPEGPHVPLVRTRFVWDGNVLVHEVKESLGAAEPPLVEERTYCFEEGDFVVLAQQDRTRQGEETTEGDWIYYVNGPNGAPERLVAADGEVICEFELSALGRATVAKGAKATTPIRFQGQYADAETGLYYNRFRYYDPETGRYISQDPLGIDGGLNLYRYVEDPLGWADPLGLAGRCTCTIRTKEPVKGKRKFKGTSGGANNHNKAVKKALSKTKLPEGVKAPNHAKGGCGEPRAITNYLKAWESEHGKITNHAQLQRALANIKSIDPHDNVLNARKVLCEYCKAFLPALGGKKLLDKAKQEGAVP